jgi:hypothetical protein
MPESTFDVESYTVLTSHSQGGVSFRNVGLSSTALAHGIRIRASVYFLENKPATLGVVYNVDQPNFNGHSVYAYCWKPDYDDFYDLVRSESPLRFRYAYEGAAFDPGKPTRELYFVQLFTGMPEPPGEGPEDVSPAGLP